MGKQVIIAAEARTRKTDLRAPCSDCPWARRALPGWLGGLTADQWIVLAHEDGTAECHTTKYPSGEFHQCYGLAQYRRNVCKLPRDPRIRRVKEADLESVFGSAGEFLQHHKGRT